MTFKDLIYLPRCPFCWQIRFTNEPCPACLDKVTELTDVVCHQCGAPPANCTCRGRSVAFSRNISAFIYDHGARQMLLRYKEGQKPQLSKFMSRRLYYHVAARYPGGFSAVTFVPQSRRSDFRRGYCPAQLLAQGLADQMGLPLVPLLQRVGEREQKELKGRARWENAHRNFALLPRVSAQGKVLLVDDLVTTGATLHRCAQLLKEAGATEVATATFCIALKNS